MNSFFILLSICCCKLTKNAQARYPHDLSLFVGLMCIIRTNDCACDQADTISWQENSNLCTQTVLGIVCQAQRPWGVTWHYVVFPDRDLPHHERWLIVTLYRSTNSRCTHLPNGCFLSLTPPKTLSCRYVTHYR